MTGGVIVNKAMKANKKIEDKFVGSFFEEDPRPKTEAAAETDESK